MQSEQFEQILKLKLACAIQAAIVATQQDGADMIALELEAVLADVQPEFLIAA